MTAFATTDDLAAYLGSDVDETRGGLLLDLASDAIRDEVSQVIDKVEDDTVVIRGSWGRDFWLPERPVLGVNSIKIDGLLLVPNTYKASHDGRLTFYRGAWASIVNLAEIGNMTHGYWGGDEVLVTVDYDHGYEEIPTNIKGLCLELAKRAFQAPTAGAIVQETVGAYSVSYAQVPGLTLTQADRARLRRFRRLNYTVPVGPA